MTDVLPGTNVFAWALQGRSHVTVKALRAITAASRVYTSSISIFEVGRNVRIGKWPAMSALAPNLAVHAVLQGISIVPLDAAICAAAASIVWHHRDPFDRMVAATALHLDCPVVSSDAAFDGPVARIR